MNHFWQTIPGFFTFPEYYSWVAEQMRAIPNPRMVEVGVYAGQSAAYMGVELINREIPAKLDLVDLFHPGVGTVVEALKPIASVLGDIRQECSWEAARHYADGSLDFVFIDADHGYNSVTRDIDAWRSKVKPGGIFAGHDYTVEIPDVIRAVNERFARFEVWPGITHGGDTAMQGKYWPVWSLRT